MATTRSALIQIIEWCPRRGHQRSDTSPRDANATPQSDLAIPDLPAARHRPTTPDTQRALQPDVRQSEPWRQAWLLDAEAQHDPARIERLTR